MKALYYNKFDVTGRQRKQITLSNTHTQMIAH